MHNINTRVDYILYVSSVICMWVLLFMNRMLVINLRTISKNCLTLQTNFIFSTFYVIAYKYEIIKLVDNYF